MIRVLLFLVLIGLIALGVVWIADRPGDIAITWQGWRIETSVMVAVVAIAALIVAVMLVWSLLRTIFRVPDLIALFLGHRRGVRGYRAISRGLVAVGAGDSKLARKAAADAERIAPGQPLTLLLTAQCAQLAGDRAAAEAAFRAMVERDDTKLLGLRGLFIEAQRRGDAAAARGYAEEAASVSPALAWSGQAVLDFRCQAGDWDGALAALDRNSRYGLIDKAQHRHQRAVLLTARAMAAEEADPDRALALALDAVKLEPTLVPAADLAGRLLGEKGELRRASRVIEKAWQAHPHPDLADTYAHLRAGDSARERLGRIEALARAAPRHIESALAVARAALDAHEFAAAREALRPFLKEPTQRVAVLMAEIERSESGDEGRAREWMARALRAAHDPAWTADGVVSDRWMPVSPGGRLDGYQWRVPVAELGGGAFAVIEGDDAVEAKPEPPPPAEEAVPARDDASDAVAEPEASPPAKPPAAVPAAIAPPPRVRAASRTELVIPLIHAPDDPGPEPAPDREPEPERAGPRNLRLFT